MPFRYTLMNQDIEDKEPKGKKDGQEEGPFQPQETTRLPATDTPETNPAGTGEPEEAMETALEGKEEQAAAGSNETNASHAGEHDEEDPFAMDQPRAISKRPPPPVPAAPPTPPTRTGETPAEGEEEGGLSFIDHLDELRGRLIRAAIALGLTTALSAFFADFLVEDVLIGPLTRSSDTLVLQNLVPYGQISLYLQAVFFSGFILAFPFLAWQIWQFVAPGLHEHERSAGRFSILFISLSFFAGIAFGYFVFLPVSLQFFAGFGSSLIENNISIQDYSSFFIGALLTAGLVFELPFLSYILSKIGLLTPAFMRFYRKHAIVFLLVVAALVTPSTDIVTQLVIGLPMILLYEISILISAHVNRNNSALS